MIGKLRNSKTSISQKLSYYTSETAHIAATYELYKPLNPNLMYVTAFILPPIHSFLVGKIGHGISYSLCLILAWFFTLSPDTDDAGISLIFLFVAFLLWALGVSRARIWTAQYNRDLAAGKLPNQSVQLHKSNR